MQQYRTVAVQRGAGPTVDISFEAESLSDALVQIAVHHQADEPAELWCEGKLLGQIEAIKTDDGLFWRLG